MWVPMFRSIYSQASIHSRKLTFIRGRSNHVGSRFLSQAINETAMTKTRVSARELPSGQAL